MARRRQGRLVVELVPDEGDDAAAAGAPDEPGHATTPARAALARWRGLARRTRVLVASGTAVAVLAVGGGVAVADAIGDHRRAAAMRTAPGGVTDLSDPPAQTWEADADGHRVVPVDGGAVVVRDGDDVLALDVATGEERWRHRVPGVVECGPWTGAPAPPVAEVVCLAGTDGDLGATVISAAGEVRGSRDLGAVSAWAGGAIGEGTGVRPQVIPMSGGLLGVLENPVDPARTFDDQEQARAELRRLRAAGREPAVRLDDALTGEVLARAEVDLDAAPDDDDLTSCSVYGGAAATSFSLLQKSSVAPGVVWTTLCGAGVAVTAEGDDIAFDADDAWSLVRTDAGLAVPSSPGTTLRTDDGDVGLPGTLMPAAADDGSDDVLLLSGEQAGGLRGVERDGTARWSTDSSARVLARADGVAVGIDGAAAVGLDLSDGAERWRRDDVLPESGEDAFLAGVATDGVRVLLAVGRSDGFDLVAVDARTGATAWREAYDTGPLVHLTTVDGRLVVTTTEDGASVLRGLATG